MATRIVDVEGTEQLRELAVKLAAADKGVRRELGGALAQATEPMKARTLSSLEDYFPDRYAAVIRTDLAFPVSKRLAGSTPTVALRIRGRRARRMVRRLDQGILNHPLFGNREHWFVTRVRPGFFTAEVAKEADAVRTEVREVVDRIQSKLAS